MRLILLFGLASAVSIAIQTAVNYWLPFRILVPNLMVILVADLGLRHHGIVPAVVAFAIGYAVDTFSGVTLGLNAFLMTLVYLFSYEISKRLLVMNAGVGIFAVFVGALITQIGDVAIGQHGVAMSRVAPVFGSLLGEAVITAIVAPAIFAILGSIKRVIGLPAGPVRE